MNAVVLNQFGGVENFEWKNDVDLPRDVMEGNVLVKIRASSFNHFDIGMREGKQGGECPMILGLDFSGVVEDIGHGVTDIKIDDEVYGIALPGYASNGSYAEYVQLPHYLVSPKPNNLNFAEAASMCYIGLMAMDCVRDLYLQPKETVLITGACEATGVLAVQQMKNTGSTIFCTIGDKESLHCVNKEQGVPHPHILNYTNRSNEELVSEVLERTDGAYIDSALDLIGGPMDQLCRSVLKNNGKYVSIDEEQKFIKDEHVKETSSKLKLLAEAIESGALQPPQIDVVGTLTASTVIEAHKRLTFFTSHSKLAMSIRPTTW
jgi:NADPH:quinone reductase-like Zn-dependent oxidoreductase